MKKLIFEVSVELSDDISWEGIQQVGQNLRNAIYDQIQGAGLAPDDEDCFTTSYTVKGLNNSVNLFTDLMRHYEQPTIDKP